MATYSDLATYRNSSAFNDRCTISVANIEGAEDERTETGLCKKVEGPINEDFWCKLFKRKHRRAIAEG